MGLINSKRAYYGAGLPPMSGYEDSMDDAYKIRHDVLTNSNDLYEATLMAVDALLQTLPRSRAKGERCMQLALTLHQRVKYQTASGWWLRRQKRPIVDVWKEFDESDEWASLYNDLEERVIKHEQQRLTNIREGTLGSD